MDGDNVAAAADQNALAKSIRDQGLSVTAEVVPKVNAETGAEEEEGIISYTLSLNGESAKNYTVNKLSEEDPNFEIVDASGKLIAKVTVASGDTISETDIGKKQSAIITAKNLMYQQKKQEMLNSSMTRMEMQFSANALKDYFTAKMEDGEESPTIMPRAGVKLYDAVGNAIDMTDENLSSMVVANPNLVGDLKLKLHVGADATKNNQITINLQAMSAKGLGVNGLQVSGNDDSNALNAIETIKSALSTVSAQRPNLVLHRTA